MCSDLRLFSLPLRNLGVRIFSDPPLVIEGVDVVEGTLSVTRLMAPLLASGTGDCTDLGVGVKRLGGGRYVDKDKSNKEERKKRI